MSILAILNGIHEWLQASTSMLRGFNGVVEFLFCLILRLYLNIRSNWLLTTVAC